MKKSFVSFLVLVLILLIGLAIYFLMDREEEVVVESNGENEIINEIVQEEDENDVLGNQQAQSPSSEFIQCLADSGMVVYASKTCPACTSLAAQFGGYDFVENLFVFCSDDREACDKNMQTNYVPEIQYNGNLFEGDRSIEAFAKLTNCEL